MKKRLTAFMSIALFMGVLIFPAATAFADADYRVIRVELSIGTVSSINVNIDGEYYISEEPGTEIAPGNYTVSVSGSQVRIRSGAVDRTVGSVLTLVRCTGGNGLTLYNDRYGCNIRYLGDIRFTVSGGSLSAINHVPLEQYLYGVVAYEMSNDFPLEALKVQAVCARSYAIMSFSPSLDYDIGDTSSDQVYRGYNSAYTNVIAAVDGTKGQVLMHGSSIAQTYYSASNGGQTELPGNAWGGGAAKNADYPYLPQRDDAFDLANPSSLYQKIPIPKQVEGSAYDCVTVTGAYVVRIIRCNVSVNVRSSPDSSSDSNIIGQAPACAVYPWVATTGDWQRIKFTDATHTDADAYISTDYAFKTPNGRYLYGNPVLADIQNLAYQQLKSGGASIAAATDVKLITVNSLANGTERWPGTGSRSYVSANASATVKYMPSGSSTLSDPADLAGLSVTLMNPSGDSYSLAHDYLNSSLRMRGVASIDGTEDHYLTAGRYGHGVGMSQRGAQQRANSTDTNVNTYDKILNFYFEGAALTAVETTVPELPSKTLLPVASSSAYRLANGTACGLSTDLDAGTFLSNITVVNGSARLLTASGTPKTTGTVVTGDILEIRDTLSRRYQTYALVLYGDINADGKISLVDLLRIQKHLLGTSRLTGAYLTAADVSKDGGVSLLDLLRVQKQLLGTTQIEQ